MGKMSSMEDRQSVPRNSRQPEGDIEFAWRRRITWSVFAKPREAAEATVVVPTPGQELRFGPEVDIGRRVNVIQDNDLFWHTRAGEPSTTPAPHSVTRSR